MTDDVTREVDQLLKDREKYESWLKKLESDKPAAASERAYQRVRGDYQRRLDEVMEKLRAHSETIRARLGELGGEVEELEGERADRAEKLDEARLRRSVGEYEDDKEWSRLEGELLGALQETEEQLERTRVEIARLEEIVALVEGAEAAPETELEEAVPGEPEREAAAAAKSAAGPVGAEAGAGVAPEDEEHVTLEELVLGDEELREAVGEPAKGEEPAKAAESAEEAVGDELAFLESLSLGGNEEAESFSFLEQRGSGTPQTIICPHCSAANDPAEWYCTECGEELPAE